MYSLSTCWNAPRSKNARELIREIKDLGFSNIELSFTMTRRLVNQLRLLRWFEDGAITPDAHQNDGEFARRRDGGFLEAEFFFDKVCHYRPLEWVQEAAAEYVGSVLGGVGVGGPWADHGSLVVISHVPGRYGLA